jgi:glucosyl-3-phosphoglycerate phosphatase
VDGPGQRNPGAPIGDASTGALLGFTGNSVWSALVLLARHGQTALNQAGLLRGHIDVPLDDVGEVEAERLGRDLSHFTLCAIVASPLARARQTANIIARMAGAEVVVDRRLVDRDYGPWAGIRVTEVREKFGSLDRAPGVEDIAAVRERALRAMRDAVSTAINGSVLVVAHDAVNRVLLTALDPAMGPFDDIPQHTGCYNLIEFSKPGTLPLAWQLRAVNVVPPAERGAPA